MWYLLKSICIWFVMVVAAVGNGLVRERLLVPWLGGAVALPLSGILLALLVFIIVFLCLPIFGRESLAGYLSLGMFWCCCTLLFEFGFGHFIVGMSWREILQLFNLAEGNLFSFVLFVTLFSPWMSARLRKLL